jgi:acyl-CoA synthetase (AMP-forming)/AMP-acid ligase II
MSVFDGAMAEVGEVGEIECRGPNVAAGFWNQPDRTQQTFHEDGRHATQDPGSPDEDGYLRVGGRKRDVIVRGGLNVSPRELEELLLRHPSVREVAIIGRPDERCGERVVAFVVPEDHQSIDIDTMSGYLADLRVARFKYPEEIRVLDAMPLTATGKIWPQALRGILEQYQLPLSLTADEKV